VSDATFFKSSYSVQGGCVEVAFGPAGDVHVRDSKARGSGPQLHFDEREWRAFLDGVRDGEFDHPATVARGDAG
jgi:hypothetical protein